MKKSVVITLHVVFWLLFGLAIFFINTEATSRKPNLIVEIAGYIMTFLYAALSFYVFYIYLFPKVLGKKKILKFIVFSIIAGLIISGLLKAYFVITSEHNLDHIVF